MSNFVESLMNVVSFVFCFWTYDLSCGSAAQRILFFNLLWKWFILLKLMCKSSHSYENVDMNYVVFPTSIRAVIEFIPIDLKHCNPLRSLFSYVSMAKIRLWYGRTWANRVQNYRLTFMPHAEWLVYTINHISHSEVCIQRKYCKIDFENICLR